MTEGFREDFRHDILPDSPSKKKVKNNLYACATGYLVRLVRQMTPGSSRVEISLQSSANALCEPVFGRQKNSETTP